MSMGIAILGFAIWLGLLAFWVGCAVWLEHRATRRRQGHFNRLGRAR